MASITVIAADGTSRTLTATAGSLMNAIVAAGIDGVVAECGGGAMCATCHVFIDAPHLPPPRDDEDAMLDGTAVDREPTSRLSCQVRISEALDGIVVRLPSKQI